MNVAINGFGRIGRATFKLLLEKKNINIVAINDLNPIETLAYLLRYDSVYGIYNKSIRFNGSSIIVDGKHIKVIAKREPAELPWADLKVDVVIESTGIFRTHALAMKHIQAGAKKVVITAPPKVCDCGVKNCVVKIIVPGVNEKNIKKSDQIISMASCTTNCLAPITSVIEKSFGIRKAIMTTIHSYTADQNLVDGANKDLRRGRAAALNMVPTTTGAAIATCEVIPELAGKFDGLAIRVPTPTVSICDVVYLLKNKTTKDNVNSVLEKSSKNISLRGILKVTKDPLVSCDYAGNDASATVDLSLTNVVDGDLVKIIAWYDNEWGYSARLAGTCEFIKKKKLL